MKRIFFLLFPFVLILSTCEKKDDGPNPDDIVVMYELEYTKIYENSETQENVCHLEIANDGGYIMTGSSRHVYIDSYGNEQSNCCKLLLLKTDAYGNQIYTKLFDGEKCDQEGYDIHITADGGYVVLANNSPDLYKTDAEGDIIYYKNFEEVFDDDFDGIDMECTQDGGYIITGNGSFGWVPWVPNYGLLKIDEQGKGIWAKAIEEFSSGRDVELTNDGGYIVTGYNNSNLWLLKTDANGDTIWTKKYGENKCGYDIELTPDGGYIIIATESLTKHDQLPGLWLLKTDAKGDTIWTKHLGENCFNPDIERTPDGGYIIVSTDDFGLWLFKTDSKGNTIWATDYKGFSGSDIEITPDGAIIIAGERWIDRIDGRDVFLMKLIPK